jgi:hypothetical protein
VSVRVELPLPVTVAGLKPGVTPEGKVLTANPTLAAKPFWGAMVTVYPALPPATTLWLAGVVPMVKSGAVVTVKLMSTVWLKLPLVAVIVAG